MASDQEEPAVLVQVLRLVETLVMLAATADEQVAWCRRHGWCEDELALDFDWANGLVPNVDEQAPGLLSPALHECLRQIDDLLGRMGGQANADKWTAVGLATDPDWAEIRNLARRALTEVTGLVRVPSPDVL
ncbi:unnamed protein product [[Actinomadura] parvosata subsp. kistnae]|uniref:hypothetical protein n=1 Tax=[Actinomadura] parvosata TaxID=1955412 RepID=UPI0009AEC85E|nr:hypothetical protein [Nonomuraea sp. ATCC 55076]SPL94582.1 unnamed protein product [Actinomadura parvosata subsp. kistnae]